jgi:hypothetical protein
MVSFPVISSARLPILFVHALSAALTRTVFLSPRILWRSVSCHSNRYHKQFTPLLWPILIEAITFMHFMFQKCLASDLNRYDCFIELLWIVRRFERSGDNEISGNRGPKSAHFRNDGLLIFEVSLTLPVILHFLRLLRKTF